MSDVKPPPVDDGFYVAVPSYQRSEDLRLKTLALLEEQEIPKHRVYIFVATPSEYAVYREALGEDWPNIVIGQPSLWRQRNFIMDWFKEGTHIVSMDDDLEGLFCSWPCTNKITPDVRLMQLPKGSLAKIAEDAKRRMVQSGAFLWSLNASWPQVMLIFSRAFDFAFLGL